MYRGFDARWQFHRANRIPQSPSRSGISPTRADWRGIPLNVGSELGKLIDQTHVGTDPSTSILDDVVGFLHGQLRVLIQAISNHQTRRTADATLAVNQNLLLLPHTIVDDFTEAQQIIHHVGVVLPRDMNVLRYRFGRFGGAGVTGRGVVRQRFPCGLKRLV